MVRRAVEAGVRPYETADGLEAWRVYRLERPRWVVANLELRGLSGIELLRRIKSEGDCIVVLHHPQPEPRAVVEAVRAGADEVMSFPKDDARMARLLNEPSGPARGASPVDREILGSGSAMRTVRERARALASLDVPVVVSGEVGVGRRHVIDVIARASSPDAAGPLIVTPERIPARIDASRAYHLREIASFEVREQARWAHECVPGAGPRVFVSTSEPAEMLARDGRLDRRFHDRFCRFVIHVPPLRDRASDVRPLATELASRCSRKLGRAGVRFTAAALRVLEAKAWPGNVRELAEVVERLVAFSHDARITKAQVESVLNEAPVAVLSSRQAKYEREREEMIGLIRDTGGNLAEVARRLNLSRGAVIYRAQKYGLTAGRRSRTAPDGRPPR
jgi:DNA-binding NtrC family response regulator